jgi:hypothetical protein
MAMNAGNATVGGGGSGLAQEMADLLLATLGSLGTPPGSTVAEQQVDDVCNAIATAVVAHIVANAEVLTSVSTTVPAPIAVQVVPATGTGATTAPGVGSGTGTGSAGSAVF